MEYLTREQLCAISIHRYDYLLKEKYGTTDVENMIADDGTEFALDDADIFRQGVCQLFAYALRETFGYTVYKIQSGTSFHIFCKSEDGTEYIDVRGKTKSFEEFVNGSDLLDTDIDDSKEYTFDYSDLNDPFYDIGLLFAEAIIHDNPERYAEVT